MNMDERGQRVWELRVNLLLEVGSNLAQHVVFRPRCIYPTLAGTRAIRAVLEREGLGTDRILWDDHEQTELEKCKGNWRPAVSGLAGPADERPDLESAAALFEKGSSCFVWSLTGPSLKILFPKMLHIADSCF